MSSNKKYISWVGKILFSLFRWNNIHKSQVYSMNKIQVIPISRFVIESQAKKCKNSQCFFFLTLQSFNCSNLFYLVIKIAYIDIYSIIYCCVHVCVCMHAHKYVYMHANDHRGQKNGTGVNSVMSLLTWVLGIELWSSEKRAASVLKGWTISPAPTDYFN